MARCLFRRRLNVQGFRKGYDAAETQVETQVNGALSLSGSARKAVHDATDSMRRPMPFDQIERVLPGFPRMNHNWFVSRRRYGNLLNEGRFLRFGRRNIVVIVQSNLANGH